MIKRNELEVGNTDFELQDKRGETLLCFTLFLNFKKLFISLQLDVLLRCGLDQNVAFLMDKWFILKNQNWILPTCDSFLLIVSHISTKLQHVVVHINPFLSAHIPYAQSEGILPKYGLLQWVEYISKSTSWISTKLCRDMVEALSFLKTLEYWWPLTYIQGHVIQDGRQIHFSKSNLGLKLPITQPIFGQIQ